MSLFRYSDYGGKRERPKKVKLPTQLKSKKCCFCRQLAVRTIQVSEKETRRLCRDHYHDYQRGKFFYKPKFERASE